jgi:hypothetical protein
VAEVPKVTLLVRRKVNGHGRLPEIRVGGRARSRTALNTRRFMQSYGLFLHSFGASRDRSS